MAHPRILIVADEPLARDLHRQLAKMGYEPLAPVRLVEEAVSLAEQLRPDLVLMAIHLRGERDGIAAAQLLHDRFDLPVVFLSGAAGDETLDCARKSASFGFLLEPFDARDLRSAVETALYRHRAETVLRQSREEQAAILRTTLDGFWLVDTQGRILEVNEACCRMLGYARDELLGKSITDIEADETSSEIAANMERIKQAGSAQLERRHRCKDGHLIDVAMSVSHLPGGSGKFSVFTRDVTEFKRDEALLGGQKQVLEMIATGAALAGTLDKLLRVIEAQAPEMLCSILLLDADGLHLRHGAAPSLPKEYLQAIDGGAIGPSAGSCGTAVFRRQAVIVEDIATDPRWVDYRGQALPHGLRACWSTPIFDAPGKVVGTFAMYYRQPGRPTASHERLIDIATQVAAIAISHARSDEALRRSETKFRTLYDSAPDGVLLLDERGRFFDCNPAALEAFGCASTAELCAKHPADLSPFLQPCGTQSQTLADQRIAAAMKTGHQRFEWVHKRADTGATFPVEVLLIALVLDGKRVLQAVVRDISERKRTEEALRASEDRYHDLVDNSQELVSICDLDGGFLSVNETTVRISGYSREALLKMNLRDLLVPETRHLFSEYSRTLQAAGEARGIMRIQTAKGEQRFWEYDTTVRTEGVAVPVVRAMALDITERLRSERALRASESQLQVILNSTEDGILAVDRQGMILKTNQRFADLWQIPPSLIAGGDDQALLDHVVAQVCEPDAFLSGVQSLYASDATGLDEIHFKDGRCFERFSTPMLEGSTLGGRVWSFRDITARKRAEQALMENEDRYRDLVDNTQEVVATYDLAGNFSSVNETAIRITGYSRETFLKMNLADLIVPEHRHLVPEFLRTMRTVGRASGILRIQTADGSKRTWEHNTTLRTAGVALPVVRGMALDITERLRSERALRASHERFELANRATFNVIWDWDLRTQVIWRNDRFQELFGYARDEVGASFDASVDLIPPEDLARVKASLQVALDARSEFWTDQYRFRRKDGSYATVEDRAVVTRDVDGRAIRMLGAMQDISERKQAEAGLRLQSGALQAAANSIVITDRTGLIEWVNQAFTSATGYSVDEAVGKRPGDLLKSGRQDAAFYEALWETIVAGTVWHGELINRRKDGSHFTEEMTVTPLKDGSGAITHFVAVKQDVTERKVLEQKFLQAQKLEAVGRLAGGIAHDFNNMLGVILGYIDVAVRQVDPSLALHADLLEIQGAAMRSATLTRQLLAFARRETITPKVMNLNETVAGMLAMLRRLIGEDIRITWQPAATLWPILMDPAQIDQILANLCVNSRDAIADVGAITIATANCAIDTGFCADHADAVPGEYVRLSVSDTGGGMDKETLSQVFEPFFTTKGVGEGTGLGLPMVYGAVRQNRGFLTVASEPGQGTVVEIYLPRDLGQAERAEKTDAVAPVVRGHETILLVEDEPALLKLTTRVLEGQGYAVIAACRPSEAIARARAPGEEIHLLLTDVVMPEMNGREVAKTLLSVYPRLKCLFMSGYTADVIAHGGVLAEGVNFLQKPFSPAELAAKVREALDRR